MSLSPVLPLFACLFISIGVLIRFKKHPKIPVITLCLLLMMLLFILCLTAIDRSVSPTTVSVEEFDFWGGLRKILIWDESNVSLDILYDTFEILKWIVTFLGTTSIISLFVETGLILRHKKERYSGTDL